MKKLLLLALGLAFTACAPQPLGSRGNPVEITPGSVIETEIGGETFLQMTAPIGWVDKGTRDKEFSGYFKDVSELSPGRSVTANVNWFKLGDMKMADGVKLEIVRQEAKREVGQTRSDTQYIYYYLIDTVKLTLAIKVDATVKEGFAPASFDIQRFSNTNLSAPFPLRLAFVPPKPPVK
jgi:hypothetical protein